MCKTPEGPEEIVPAILAIRTEVIGMSACAVYEKVVVWTFNAFQRPKKIIEILCDWADRTVVKWCFCGIRLELWQL